MELDHELTEGQTPLDEDEKEGLLISTITTRRELDEFEQQNIEHAMLWTMAKKFKKDEIFTEAFVRQVHRKMFGEVWNWAGEFRRTNKNLGVDWTQVAVALRTLTHDATFWIENKTYPPDEIAVRFKHRVVQIHCFSNGNGRHSRLMGDIIIEKIFRLPVFSWGANSNLTRPGESRKEYLAAIKAADQNDILPLLTFARK